MVRARIPILALALLAGAISGATGRAPASDGSPAGDPFRGFPVPSGAETVRPYNPSIRASEPKSPRIQQGCRIRTISLSGEDPLKKSGSMKVEIEVFEADTATTWTTPATTLPSRSLVILPPTGGQSIVDTSYAMGFCAKGVRTVIVDSWPDSDYENRVLDLGYADRNLIRALAAVKYVIEFLGTDVGLFGTSVGAILASSIAAYEPRVIGLATVVGGYPLPAIMATSEQETMRMNRRQYMAALRISKLDDYLAYLRGRIKIDPKARIEARAKEIPVIMQVAEGDRTVPTSTQNALWELWGRPTKFTEHCDHVEAVLRSYILHREEITDFFLKILR